MIGRRSNDGMYAVEEGDGVLTLRGSPSYGIQPTRSWSNVRPPILVESVADLLSLHLSFDRFLSSQQPSSLLFTTYLSSPSALCSARAVHARYTGTGHADTNKWEWATHQGRDTYA